MAKYYLEIKEQLTEEEMLTKQPQEFRKEYATLEAAQAASPAIEAMLFDGVNYIRQVHVCHHEDGIGCELINF